MLSQRDVLSETSMMQKTKCSVQYGDAKQTIVVQRDFIHMLTQQDSFRKSRILIFVWVAICECNF